MNRLVSSMVATGLRSTKWRKYCLIPSALVYGPFSTVGSRVASSAYRATTLFPVGSCSASFHRMNSALTLFASIGSHPVPAVRALAVPVSAVAATAEAKNAAIAVLLFTLPSRLHSDREDDAQGVRDQARKTCRVVRVMGITDWGS